MNDPQPARSDISQDAPAGASPEDLRARIFAQPDLKKLAINVTDWPDLDGELYVRKMKARERSQFERSMNFDPHGNARNLEDLQTRLAILTLVTKDGSRVFADEHLDELAGKSSLAMQEIFDVAAELNGLTKEAADAIAKN